jgi:uncharacterized protein (TIGR02246 family)
VADESRIDELVAYEEIRRLVADYAHGVDKRDRDRFAAVWHEDAEWQPMPGGDWLKGRDAIVDALGPIWDGNRETHHWTSNHSIQVDGDSATGLVDLDCVLQTADAQWFRVAAAWHDDYERRGERWAIARRTIEIYHHLPIADA